MRSIALEVGSCQQPAKKGKTSSWESEADTLRAGKKLGTRKEKVFGGAEYKGE